MGWGAISWCSPDWDLARGCVLFQGGGYLGPMDYCGSGTGCYLPFLWVGAYSSHPFIQFLGRDETFYNAEGSVSLTMTALLPGSFRPFVPS